MLKTQSNVEFILPLHEVKLILKVYSWF